jgi:GNAT superfamily N-acetyltransferase
MDSPTPTDERSRIRPVEPRDVCDLIDLVRELAIYEKEPDAATATADQFSAILFPAAGEPTAYGHVAEVRTAGGDWEVVGMALWFLTFSTWTGTNGIWLEDLFVRPGHRGSGLGQALLRTLAGICVERGYHRLEWWVLDWNEPSIGFYRSIGAEEMDEWTRFRLDGAALEALGQ